MRGCTIRPVLLNVLAQNAIIDTWETAGKFRDNLTLLDTYTTSINANNKEFNCCVNLNNEGIKYQGEHFDVTMSNMFKGYNVVQGKEFAIYMATKKDE